MNAPDRKAALQGMGDSRLRKEDARFIQGKGNYVDDIKLPGMLHMDIVRSPLAHARIKKINKEKALELPTDCPSSTRKSRVVPLLRRRES